MTEAFANVMPCKLELRTRATLCALARGVLFSSAAFGGLAAAQFTPPSAPPVIPPSAPPVRLWDHGGGTIKFGEDIYRDLYIRTLDKAVSFEWRWVTPHDSSPTNVKAHTSEAFATAYWPTIVAMGRDRMFVGGKSEDGATILERWTFDSKSDAGHPAPTVELTCGALGAETPHYEWTLPPRIRVDEIVHLPPDSPQGLIRAVLPNLKSKEKLFVYYDGSSELCEVDLATRTQTLRASPTGASSSLNVPELGNAYNRCWAVDYAARGNCYFFGTDMESPTDSRLPIPRVLVLIDSDRDGKVDSSKLISPEEWKAYWGNRDNFAIRKD